MIKYLENPNESSDHKTRMKVVSYILYDKELYKKCKDYSLLRCLSKHKAMLVMIEVHEKIYGPHQAKVKMRWLVRRHGSNWPIILENYIRYTKKVLPGMLKA